MQISALKINIRYLRANHSDWTWSAVRQVSGLGWTYHGACGGREVSIDLRCGFHGLSDDCDPGVWYVSEVGKYTEPYWVWERRRDPGVD